MKSIDAPISGVEVVQSGRAVPYQPLIASHIQQGALGTGLFTHLRLDRAGAAEMVQIARIKSNSM